jgi:hypothetical protein
MQLLLLVLNQVDKLDDLIDALIIKGISGATIWDSIGMLRELADRDEYQPIFGSQWFLDNPERKESKTIFLVVNEKQTETVKGVIRQVIGDISQPDTAVLFTLPILSVEGIEV